MPLNLRREPKQSELRQMSAGLRLAAAGMTLAFSVVIGAGFGYWLDQKYKTTWCTPVFALLGVIAGFREMILAANAANRADDAARAERRAASERERDGDETGSETTS
jgi:F0F1-type ATP synthase assembly protein I